MKKILYMLTAFSFLFLVSGCNTGLHTTTQVGGMDNDQNHHNSITNSTETHKHTHADNVAITAGISDSLMKTIVEQVRKPLIEANKAQLQANKQQMDANKELNRDISVLATLHYKDHIELYNLKEEFKEYKSSRKTRDKHIVSVTKFQQDMLDSNPELKKKHMRYISLIKPY